MPSPQPPIPLPRLVPSPLADLAEARNLFQASTELPLGQTWLGKTERDFQPGRVLIGWCPQFFHVFADLEDRDIIPAGSSPGSSTLTVSDIFQVFLNRPHCGDYLEIHVTPDNQTRAMSWTPERFSRFCDGEISIDEILLEKSGDLVTETWVDEAQTAWNAYIRIPIHILSPRMPHFQASASFTGTFCRFDASPDSVEPVLSSSSTFKEGPRFHECAEWHQFVLQD
ncbi:MAG: hypothetical protein ACQKBT_06645 [Puniceicoccales bacterium]